MKFSTNNVQISMTIALATEFRAKGFDVFWHSTREQDNHTNGGIAKDVVTLVPEFPANPAFIVRKQGLRSDSPVEEIVVPAFSVQLPSYPKRGEILGLGHPEYEWDRLFRVDGLAADEFQHRQIGDLLHDWLQSIEEKEFSIYDYDTDPANPPLLGPVRIKFPQVERLELVQESEAARYYIRATAILRYVE